MPSRHNPANFKTDFGFIADAGATAGAGIAQLPNLIRQDEAYRKATEAYQFDEDQNNELYTGMVDVLKMVGVDPNVVPKPAPGENRDQYAAKAAETIASLAKTNKVDIQTLQAAVSELSLSTQPSVQGEMQRQQGLEMLDPMRYMSQQAGIVNPGNPEETELRGMLNRIPPQGAGEDTSELSTMLSNIPPPQGGGGRAQGQFPKYTEMSPNYDKIANLAVDAAYKNQVAPTEALKTIAEIESKKIGLQELDKKIELEDLKNKRETFRATVQGQAGKSKMTQGGKETGINLENIDELTIGPERYPPQTTRHESINIGGGSSSSMFDKVFGRYQNWYTQLRDIQKKLTDPKLTADLTPQEEANLNATAKNLLAQIKGLEPELERLSQIEGRLWQAPADIGGRGGGY